MRSIPPITSTGHSRTRFRLGLSIGIGGLRSAGTPSPIFKAASIPAKIKKKTKTINIKLLPEKGGLLKMYID